MISSQTQIIESQQLKSLNQSKLYSAGVDRIIDALKKQIKYEKTVKINPNNFSLRSKYQVMLNRQQDIIFRLKREIDNLQMCKEEATMLQYEYEKMCHDYTGLLINYIQYIEERITIQKEKLLIRMSGISKIVIDDVIEEKIIPKYPTSHSFIFLLQSCSLRLIGDTIIPKPEIFDPLIKYLSSLGPRSDPIVLFNALQFLEILCSQNWGILGKVDFRNEHRKVVHKLLLIIPHGFMYLKNIWDEMQSHVIPIFIIQIFQALNPLLNILNIMNSEYSTIYATNHHIIADKSSRDSNHNLPEDEDDEDENRSYNDGVNKDGDDDNSSNTSRSDKRHKDRYYCFGENYSFELLIEDIILWLKLFKIAKLQLLHQSTLSVEVIQVVNKILKVHNEQEISVQHVHNILRSHRHHSGVDEDSNIDVIDNGDDCDGNSDNYRNNYDGNKTHHSSSSKQIFNIFNRKSDIKFNKKLKVIKHVSHEISKLLLLGSSLTTNILQCVEKLIYFLTNESIDDKVISINNNAISINDNTLPRIDSILYFGSMAHTLLLYSLDLGIINCSKFAMILGGQENPLGACISDYKFLKAVDNEVAITIQLATISFSFGLWETLAYDVVRNASSIIMHRSSNMVLSSAWLHCLIACTLCCLEIEPPEPHITSDALRHYYTMVASPSLDIEAHNNNNSASNQQLGNISTNNSSIQLNRSNTMKSTASTTTTYYNNDHKNNHKSNNDYTTKTTKSVKFFDEKKCNDRLFLIPFMTYFIDKLSVIHYLHSMAVRILGVTYSLKHLLPITHAGLLLLRLLLRAPFMNRLEAENLLDISLTHILQPLVSEVTVKRVSDDDDDDNNNNDEKASSQSNKLSQASQIVDVTMSTYLSEADPTDVNTFHNRSSVDDANRPGSPEASVDSVSFSKSSSRGTSSKGNPQSVDTYWAKWHAEHYIQAFQGTASSSSGGVSSDKKAGGINASDTNLKTLLTFLVYIGESHLQSTEVIEQLLLFIEQMLSKSPVLRHAMDDTGIPMVIQRIIDSQQNNIYMVALAELCLDVFK